MQKDKTNAYGEPFISLKPPIQFNVKVEKVPELEWWDEFFVPPQTQNQDKDKEKVVNRFDGEIEEKDIFVDRITHYV